MDAHMDAVAVSRYRGDRMTKNVESRTEWEELKQQIKTVKYKIGWLEQV